jgi:hypothetical protein
VREHGAETVNGETPDAAITANTGEPFGRTVFTNYELCPVARSEQHIRGLHDKALSGQLADLG